MKLVIVKKVACRAPREQLQKLADKTIKKFGKKHANELGDISELSLVFVGKGEIKKINNTYRKKNKPTDVLSFDYGEIIICEPIAKKQAVAHGISLTAEIKLLFVHGLLHVLGFDHEKPNENLEMREAERTILGYDGLINLVQDV